jgi:hypothetical protein
MTPFADRAAAPSIEDTAQKTRIALKCFRSTDLGSTPIKVMHPKLLEIRPTQVDFGIRATFWVVSRRGGGRVGSASRSESYEQIDP